MSRKTKALEIWILFFRVKTLKKIMLFIFVVLVAILFAQIVSKKLPEFLLLELEVTNHPFLLLAYFILLISFFLLSWIVVVKNKYLFAFWEYLLIFGVLSYFYFLRWELIHEDWRFAPLYGKINLFDPFVFITIGMMVFTLVWSLIVRPYRSSVSKRTHPPNEFIEDSPIKCKGENKKYGSLIDKIRPVLFTDRYNKAFSVGITGQWGIGKSSFIDEIKHEIEIHNKFKFEKPLNWKGYLQLSTYTNLNKIEYFSFSPFLNHNEDQVIHEFFKQFSNVLKTRSGNLSNKLVAYSEKLSNVVKDGNLLSVLKPTQNISQKESVGELYDNISKLIRNLDIKIIISIDDLDRLSSKEILQVLKLIRNSSNFPNTVFLVALDKQYVLDALKNEKSYLSDRFLDKFFQLEISLSKISIRLTQEFLCENIVDRLVRKGLGEKEYKDLEEVLLNNNNSFKWFIFNFRDSKRFVNQFILDFLLVNKNINAHELDYIDLVNITLLKINFPNFFNLLINEQFKVIPIVNNSVVIGFKKHDNLEGNQKLAYYVETVGDIKNYDIINSFNIKEHTIVYDNKVFSYKLGLLLIRLFGVDDIPSIKTTSIKREKVLRYYLERTLKDTEVSSLEFAGIYSLNTIDMIEGIAQFGLNQDKLKSFSDKLMAKSVNDSQEIERKIIALLEVSKNLNDTPYNEFRILNDAYVKLETIDSNSFNKLYLNMLHDNSLVIEKKAILISSTHDLISKLNDGKAQILNATKIYIRNLFNLANVQGFGNMWKVIYHVYLNLNKVSIITKELNASIITELKKPQTKLQEFCEQLLKINSNGQSWSFNQETIGIFGNIEKFKKFLQGHKQKENDAILELIEFIDLLLILKNQSELIFEFKTLKPKDISGNLIESDIEKKFGHIIFEIHPETYNKIKTSAYKELIEYDLHEYTRDNMIYLFITLGDDRETAIMDIIRRFKELLEEVYLYIVTQDQERIQTGALFLMREEVLISIHSIQPIIDYHGLDNELPYELS